MSPKPRRIFTDEQKAEAVRIVAQSDKPISQIAQEMGLTSHPCSQIRWDGYISIPICPNCKLLHQ